MPARAKKLGEESLRQLAAAVILQAMIDARSGDDQAAAWLDTEGMELARCIGISAVRIRLWRERCATLGRRAVKGPGRRGVDVSQKK